MQKTSMKVIELFIYAGILIAAIVWAVHHGGLYAPDVNIRPPTSTEAPVSTSTTPPMDMSIYNPVPAAEQGK